MPITIGAIDEADLEIKAGSSFFFDVTYKDSDGVVVPISSVRSVIRDGYDGEVVLDVGAHTTIVNNTALVRIPDSATALLPHLQLGRWDFEVTSTSGEEIPLMEGRVRVQRSTIP